MDNLSKQIREIISRGNIAEVKQERGKIVIIEIRRKAIYKEPLITG